MDEIRDHIRELTLTAKDFDELMVNFFKFEG
jgi:hypothetical protein